MNFRTITTRICAQHAWALSPALDRDVADELARVYLVTRQDVRASLLEDAHRLVERLVEDGTFARGRAAVLARGAVP